MKNNYLKVNELASVLGGLSHQAVYKMLKSKNLESIMLSTRKKVIAPSSVRAILENKGFQYPNKIISFDMIKGGVGKTTLSAAVATRASHYGCKTLLIDFDLQGNLSRSFAIHSNNEKIWIDLVKDAHPAEKAIISISQYLDIIPSNLNNSKLDIEMQQASINIKDHVRDKLDSVLKNYDLVIIDCPPAINKVSASAICASDLVIIPLNPDPYSMDGLEMTLSEIRRTKKNFKINRPDHLIVWNKYDARKRLGPVYMYDLVQKTDVQNISTIVIRTDSNYENYLAKTESIFDASKKSNAKEDIDQITKEIIGLNLWSDKN